MSELQKEMKKRTFKNTIAAKHWKNECNQKTKIVNICKIINFILQKKAFLKQNVFLK